MVLDIWATLLDGQKNKKGLFSNKCRSVQPKAVEEEEEEGRAYTFASTEEFS